MQLAAAFVWIEGTFLARFIATAPFVYPIVSALHLFGVALVFGSIVPVDLRLMRVVGSQFDQALPSLVHLALFGFAVAALSGLLLASVRIGDYANNPAFLTKLLILTAAGMNALLLRFLSGTRSISDMVGEPAGWSAATASLSIWITAVLAGRWIAFS